MKTTITTIAIAVATAGYAQTVTDTVNTNTNPSDTLLIEVDEFTTTSLTEFGVADEDGTDHITLSLSGTDAAAFTLAPDTATVSPTAGTVGELLPQVTLDATAQARYDFTITATDDEGLSAQAQVKVQVNPLSLTDITPDSLTIAENSVGQSVTLSTTVTLPNGNAQQVGGVSYTLVSVNGITPDPNQFSIAGTDLSIGANFDYEQEDLYELEVVADRGNKTLTDMIYVTITNVNESPFKIWVK